MDHSVHSHFIHMLSELDPMDLLGFVGIFSFSFMSSLHCGFMCAPLVCSFMGDRAKLSKPGIWFYNFGRILSYTIMGWLLGHVGEGLMESLPNIGKFIATSMGLSLLLIAILKIGTLLNFWAIDIEIPKLKLNRIFNLVQQLPLGGREFLFGFITVLIPCMTLTPVLVLAATTFVPLKGALLLLAFGLGTLPIMIGATYVPLLIYRKLPPKMVHWLVAIFFLVAGIITIMR